MKKLISIIVSITFILGLVLAQAVPIAAEGDCVCGTCYTPGFWKNHTEAWIGYDTEELVGDVFENVLPENNVSLLEALSFGGGPGIAGAQKILLRAAVAALLNVENGCSYPNCILTLVNNALAGGDRETIIDLAEALDAFNNSGED